VIKGPYLAVGLSVVEIIPTLVCLSLYFISIKASLIKGKQVLREVECTHGLGVLRLVILIF
jgi:hypothetical protein